MDVAHARLCLAWCAACRLLRGTVDVPDFAPGVLADPAVLDLARRVDLMVDYDHGPTAIVPQTVEVVLAGGERYEVRLDHLLGSPAAPLDQAARLDKVRRCARQGRRPLPDAGIERLIGAVDALAELHDAAMLHDIAVARSEFSEEPRG
jgi:2-methylcitrate dehydratase PrpD